MAGKKYTIEEIKTIVEPIARKYGVWLLCPSKVDILTTGSLEDDFLRKIQKEEVLLYGG